jgi:hypothetical protein
MTNQLNIVDQPVPYKRAVIGAHGVQEALQEIYAVLHKMEPKLGLDDVSLWTSSGAGPCFLVSLEHRDETLGWCIFIDPNPSLRWRITVDGEEPGEILPRCNYLQYMNGVHRASMDEVVELIGPDDEVLLYQRGHQEV